jgi:hypothetical protein
MLRTASTTSRPPERVCDELKLQLVELLVPPCLELLYCVSADVANLARDLYLDVLAAELNLTDALAAVRAGTV